jgi:hypothetical protein
MPEPSPELIASAVNARPITTKQGILERLFNLSLGVTWGAHTIVGRHSSRFQIPD